MNLTALSKKMSRAPRRQPEWQLWFFLILAFVLAGCGGGGAPPVDWSEIPVAPGVDVYRITL